MRTHVDIPAQVAKKAKCGPTDASPSGLGQDFLVCDPAESESGLKRLEENRASTRLQSFEHVGYGSEWVYQVMQHSTAKRRIGDPVWK